MRMLGNDGIVKGDLSHKIADALTTAFYASYYIDLQNDSFQIFRGKDYAKKALEGCKTIDETYERFITRFVHADDQAKMREFCDVSTLQERLAKNDIIDCEYRGTFVDAWCKTSFIPVDYDANGKLAHVLFVLSRVDTSHADELERSIHLYQERLSILERNNEDALIMLDVNVTKNTYSNLQINNATEKHGDLPSGYFFDLLQAVSMGVTDPAERSDYIRIFDPQNLLERYQKGETHIHMEHFYRVNDTHTEWVETALDMMRDPISGDVVGICYAKSLNENKISRYLLDAALDRDYPMAALVYADSGEYYYYEVDRGDYCVRRSDYWGAVYECLAHAVQGPDLQEVRSQLTAEKVLRYLQKHRDYVYTFYAEYRGQKCRMEAKFRFVNRRHNLVLATLRNITDSALYEEYKFASEHDPVTGLLNRQTLFKRCRQLLNEHPDERFMMFHGDIRNFHLYNTFFGEEAGDELLCTIAEALRNLDCEFEHWAYGRIESDVFCAFFPYTDGAVEKLIHYLLDEIPKMRNDFLIEPVTGAYEVRDRSLSVEAMFSRASMAAKSNKRNLCGRITLFDASMEQSLQDSQMVNSEMQKAIQNEEFQVYLQPKYDLSSEQLCGAEALVRWIHPTKGIISPGKFIPVFESNGFITTLDRYMWEHVAQILRRWQAEGKNMYPISVNVSRISMYIQSTVPYLIDLVKRYGIEAKYLQLELTESAYMDDPEDLKRMLRELKAAGFTILMDDFGSGYSSLNTLRELPVDVLKLDMKFLSASQSDERSVVVLSSVVQMSKQLKLPVVAEGVELREQADFLKGIKCDYVQGYLFAKPMPVKDYEKLI